MPTYFQPVPLPERCLLREVLYWLTFQRLPVYETDHEGTDIRESDEEGGYAIEVGDSFVDAEECKRANNPVDPNYLALIEKRSTLQVSYYVELLQTHWDADKSFCEEMEKEREEAKKFERECELWKSHYLRAIEYPASRIFVALRSGQLHGSGRLLPANVEEAKEKVYMLPTTASTRLAWNGVLASEECSLPTWTRVSLSAFVVPTEGFTIRSRAAF